MSKQARASSKALRVGVLLDGRLLEERLFFRPQTVTLGRSPKRADFVVPSEALPDCTTLFSRGDGRFWLDIVGGAHARVSKGVGAPVRLVKPSPGGEATRRIPLGAETRGKVSFGEVTVLFQVVTRARPAKRPTLPRSLRGAWFGGFNPITAAAIALSALLQIGFVGWLATQEWPEPLEAQMLVENDFARILRLPPAEDAPDPDDESVEKVNTSAEADPSEAASADENPPDKKPSDDASASKPDSDAPLRLSEAVEEETILGVITTTNEDGESAVDAFLAASGDADLDSAFAGANKMRVGDPADRKELASGRDDQSGGKTVGVGGLERTSGARQADRDVDTGQKAEEDVECHGCTLTSLPEEPSTPDAYADSQTISDAIRRVEGRIQHCYDRKAKMYPDLGGKVVVTFTIEPRDSRGRVVDSRASVDNVGQGVGACVADEIKRIRLPKPRGKQVVVNKAFIFERGG